MTTSGKVAYNTIVQIAGRGLNVGLALVMMRYLTAYLHAAGYGGYTTAVAFTGVFYIIADFGLSLSVSRELASRSGDLAGWLGNVLALRLAAALLTMGCAPLLSLAFPYTPAVRGAIALAALGGYFLSVNQVFVGVFQKDLALDRVVLGDCAGKAAILVLSLLCIRWKLGLPSLAAAIMAGNLVTLLIGVLLVRSRFRLTLRWDFAVWRDIFARMLPMGLVAVFGMIYIRSDMIILSVLKGGGDVGIYGVAYKFYDILMAVSGFFMAAVFPLLAASSGRDRERFLVILQRAGEVMLIVAVPIGATFFTLAPRFISLVSPAEFAPAAAALRILTVGIVFAYLGQLPLYALMAVHREKALVAAYLVLITENIFFNLLFIPRFSYLAAAAITSLTELTGLVITWVLLRRFCGFSPSLRVLPGVFLAAAAMAAVEHALRETFPFALAAGALLYPGLLFALRVVDRRSVALLFKRRG